MYETETHVPGRRTGPDFQWLPAYVDILRERWGTKGNSAMTIALAIGNGCSKNAVISKARRIGLPRLESPIRRVAGGDRAFVKKHGFADTAVLAQQTGLAPKTVRSIVGARERPSGRLGSVASAGGGPKAPMPASVLEGPANGGAGIEFGAQKSTQCSAPLWGDDTPAHEKRVCGAPVVAGCYCAKHAAVLLARPKAAAAAKETAA